MHHTLAICRTCPRDGQTAVTPLGDDLRAAIAASPLADEYEIQTLHCLGACKQPCTIAFAASGKWRLRFSRLCPDHLSAVLATAAIYCRSADGLIARSDLPEAIVNCFSAASPEGLMCKRGAVLPPKATSADRQ